MKNRLVVLFFIISLLFIFSINCATHKTSLREKIFSELPKVQREFRAAWVATVANINWPSKPGLATEEQKKETIKLLDLLQDLNFNAVVFQVRPQCDALYKSNFEPWSYYLTGQQGQVPDPYYDPLEFWIEEAHKRGIELHTWLNPYRAHHVSGGEVSEHSIVKKHPELAVKLKTGYYWLDPSHQGTQDHSYNVVMDIVKRYDVDGIHFDDYFYPYPSYNNNEDFPDDKTWQEYKNKGGELSRGDWRRESVNKFIKRLYKGIKQEKSHVKFGLSPFGIWRPNNPESIQGFDQHNQLYADARLWLNEGWIDYWTPQLYWPVNQIPQSYPVLLGWWENENKRSRHFWPGMSIGRYQGERAADEVVNQIMITRGMLPENPGNVHWSIGPLISNHKLADALVEGPYKKQALVPNSPWLDKKSPHAPKIQTSIVDDELEISWTFKNEKDISNLMLYTKYEGTWDYKIIGSKNNTISIPLFVIKNKNIRRREITEATINSLVTPLSQIAFSVVDRAGNESVPQKVSITDFTNSNIPSIEKLVAELPPDFHLPFLEEDYESFRFCTVPLKELKNKDVVEMLEELNQQFPKSFFYKEIGRSVENRPIHLIRFGKGETKFLLWSQMHGNEPTATAALFDIFNYFLKNENRPFVQNILENVTILAVPMLNPDGAEKFTRRNAQGIDVNRDARDLQSPEGQLLFQLKEKYKPDFGFNLHDQNARTTVGNTNKLVALALMAPPYDFNQSDNPVRTRAKKVVTVIQKALEPYLEGHISKYDADYMPRSFGDSMQSWGVSTVLIESGGWYEERDEFLQKINFIALLSSFDAIANGSYEKADPQLYDSLKENDKNIYDLLIQDVTVIDGTGIPPYKMDIAINYNSKDVGSIVDTGDLDFFASKDTINGNDFILTPGLVGILHDVNFDKKDLVKKSQELIKKGFTTILFSARKKQFEQTVAWNDVPVNLGSIYFIDKKLKSSQDTLKVLRNIEKNMVGLISDKNTSTKNSATKFLKKPVVLLADVNQNLILGTLNSQTIKCLTKDQTDQWKIPRRGIIRSGQIADFVLFSKSENTKPVIHSIYIKGHPIWRDGQWLETKVKGDRWLQN